MAAGGPDVVPAAFVAEHIHPVVHGMVGQHVQQRQPAQGVGQPHTAGFGAQYGHFTASFPKIYCNTILAHPRAACNRAGFAVQ